MKLADYLSTHRITHAEFAATIGATQAAVSRYANGKRMPRQPLLRKIMQATQGRVTANDFMAIPSTEVAA